MAYLRGENAPRVFVLLLLVSTVVSAAHADPIAPSYTIVDLSAGSFTFAAGNGSTVPVDPSGVSSAALSTAANGGQIVSVSNGQTAYPFVFTPDTPLTQGIVSSLPLAQPAPVNNPQTFGIPDNAYSIVLGSPAINANGIAVATDSAGVFGHFGTETAYYVQRNPDGSWGAPVVIWSGGAQIGQGPSVGGVTIAGINNLNQVLGTMTVNSTYGLSDAVLYDIKTHTLTDLSTLLLASNFLDVQPLAIDDQGRILVDATSFNPAIGRQTLLLTPAGVSSDPLQVPAPEPGSLAVMVLAMAAFAGHHIRASSLPLITTAGGSRPKYSLHDTHHFCIMNGQPIRG